MTAKKKTDSDLPDEDQGEKKRKKKINPRVYYFGIPAFLITAILIFGLMPIQGTMKFGLCKTFIEKRYTFPLYMDILDVKEREADVRIEYTVMNEFGDTMFHTITCVFRPDPAATMIMVNAVLDRRKIDQAELEAFNKTIPVILAHPPDLRVPAPKNEDLMSLWKEQKR